MNRLAMNRVIYEESYYAEYLGRQYDRQSLDDLHAGWRLSRVSGPFGNNLDSQLLLPPKLRTLVYM